MRHGRSLRYLAAVFLAAALSAAAVLPSVGCLGAASSAQVPAALAQNLPLINRLLAKQALVIMTDFFRLATNVRTAVRAVGLPAAQQAALEARFTAFQAEGDKAIEKVRAESKAVDPVLSKIGTAVTPLGPLFEDVAKLARGHGTALDIVIDSATATLDAVLSYAGSAPGQP